MNPPSLPSKDLVLACSAALGKLREARLADYGSFPSGGEALASMALTYAEALTPDGEVGPFDPVPDAECVALACRRLVRSPCARMPSAGEFRLRCEEAWREVYRHASATMLDASGREVAILATVRRDLDPEAAAAVLRRRVERALSLGYSAPPCPLRAGDADGDAPAPTTGRG